MAALPILVGTVVGGIVGALTAFIRAYASPKKCPQCAEPLPAFRLPDSWGRLWRGGWTCAKCGCRIDRYDNRIG